MGLVPDNPPATGPGLYLGRGLGAIGVALHQVLYLRTDVQDFLLRKPDPRQSPFPGIALQSSG